MKSKINTMKTLGLLIIFLTTQFLTSCANAQQPNLDTMLDKSEKVIEHYEKEGLSVKDRPELKHKLDSINSAYQDKFKDDTPLRKKFTEKQKKRAHRLSKRIKNLKPKKKKESKDERKSDSQIFRETMEELQGNG